MRVRISIMLETQEGSYALYVMHKRIPVHLSEQIKMAKYDW